jgi:uncharacterized protein Yka (UPF0111/DUF47 family)
MVNQNIQESFKKFQDNKNKEYEKIPKQINECVGALNKHSETENTINREINDLRSNIDNIKKEVIWFSMIWKTSEKTMKQKYKTQWKSTPETRKRRGQNLRT